MKRGYKAAFDTGKAGLRLRDLSKPQVIGYALSSYSKAVGTAVLASFATVMNYAIGGTAALLVTGLALQASGLIDISGINKGIAIVLGILVGVRLMPLFLGGPAWGVTIGGRAATALYRVGVLASYGGAFVFAVGVVGERMGLSWGKDWKDVGLVIFAIGFGLRMAAGWMTQRAIASAAKQAGLTELRYVKLQHKSMEKWAGSLNRDLAYQIGMKSVTAVKGFLHEFKSPGTVMAGAHGTFWQEMTHTVFMFLA